MEEKAKFPSTTCDRARDNLDFDKAIEIISNIATWKRNFVEELKQRKQDHINAAKRFDVTAYNCYCELCKFIDELLERLKP